MTKTFLPALALLAWPALTAAQGMPAAGTEPTASPPPAYRSALDYQPRGVVAERDDWTAANARVGRYRRGHIDILKAEQTEARQPVPAPPQPPKEPR